MVAEGAGGGDGVRVLQTERERRWIRWFWEKGVFGDGYRVFNTWVLGGFSEV